MLQRTGILLLCVDVGHVYSSYAEARYAYIVFVSLSMLYLSIQRTFFVGKQENRFNIILNF